MATEHASYSLFSNRPVTLLWLARVSTSVAYQMQVVAVGWQIYEMTSSPMQLGLVGLMQFIRNSHSRWSRAMWSINTIANASCWSPKASKPLRSRCSPSSPRQASQPRA